MSVSILTYNPGSKKSGRVSFSNVQASMYTGQYIIHNGSVSMNLDKRMHSGSAGTNIGHTNAHT